MSRKRLLLAVVLLSFGCFLLGIPAHAQSVEYDCQATLQSLAASNPELHCTCACATCRASCSQGSSSSSGGSGRSSSISTNDMIKQQVAATVVDAFINMLFSTDSKAAAQKQKMMEELARRKAEAERQHKIEEALRLEAISNRLAATLKLSGVPSLKLKDAGSSSGGLRLKLGDSGEERAGIKGLPGIALNDTTGNGGNTPYGIAGLPGIYTNGPATASGNAPPASSTSETKLRLKFGDGPVPATVTSPSVSPSPSNAFIDPQNMTPGQLADLAAQVNDLPPEEQQRLMSAAQKAAIGSSSTAEGVSASVANSADQPAASQLQQTADSSQSAVTASSLEDAATKARLGFDQSNGGLPKPGGTLAVTGVQATGSPRNQAASTSSTETVVPVAASAKPMPATSLDATSVAKHGSPIVATAKPDMNTPPACSPAIVKAIPSRKELQKELAVRRAQLENLKNTIVRLNRTIQLDQQQFAVWEDEASSAVKRLKDRVWDMGTKAALESFVDLHNARFEAKQEKGLLNDFDRDQWRKLEHIGTLQTFDDYRKWALEDQGDWEKLDGGIRQLIDSLPLKSEPIFYLQCSQYLIDNAYDVTDFVATWDNVQQLDRNSTNFLSAVRQNGERMKLLVQKIHEIEAQLNSTPVGPPNVSPCRDDIGDRAVSSSARR